jgi:abhydrolase domain-containing protein 6
VAPSPHSRYSSQRMSACSAAVERGSIRASRHAMRVHSRRIRNAGAMMRIVVVVWLVFVLQSMAHSAATTPDAPKQTGSTCPIATSTAKLGKGTVAYNTVGSGPNVLLIHGLFASKEQWNAFACMLADGGFHVIAVDVPGYGASKGFALADYVIDREAELIHALMQQLGIASVDVVGNSMGGAIAARYASRYPVAVRSLAFIGAPLGVVRWNQGVRDAILRGTNPFIPVNEDQLDVELKLLFVTPPVLPEPEKKSIVDNYVAHNRHYVQVWNVVNLYGDILARSPPAPAPTLIVWGVQDHIYDVAGAQRLKRRIPHSEVHELANAGHLPQVENASEVAPIYLRFLRDAKAAAPAQ